MPCRLLALLCLFLASPLAAQPASPVSPPIPDMDNRMAACAGCHGEYGRSQRETYYPSIAGKPAGYLYEQLLNFRAGRRHQTQMQQMLTPLSTDYMREMAAYYAGQTAARHPSDADALDPAAAARGEQLALHGDAALDVPACRDCHGAGLRGGGPYVPGLVGLRREYIEAQLGGWQSGARSALAPDCMATIAQRLSGEDMAAVAGWIAAQPVQPKAAGETEIGPLPMNCGAVR
ncbi:MAG: cytochrome C [Salinisphaeraceae bacterium]|nr:cytochrome C [Salinisphaeraceae bacterium]